MKEGFSSIFDHLDLSDIPLQQAEGFDMQAPTRMFFVQEIPKVASIATTEESKTTKTASCSSILDVVTASLDSFEMQEVWKVDKTGKNIIRVTDSVINKKNR